MRRNQHLVSLICLALCSPFVVAQTSTTVRLNDTVVDVMGAAISKVQITISNSTASYKAESDENGLFSINLPVGTYQLRSDKLPGFAGTNLDLVILTGKTADVTIVPPVSLEDPHVVEGRPLTNKTISVCPIEYTAVGKTARWHFNFTYTVVSGADGTILKVADLRHDKVPFVNEAAIVECIRTWKLSPQGQSVVLFSIGTTGDGNYISIVDSDGNAIKLVLP